MSDPEPSFSYHNDTYVYSDDSKVIVLIKKKKIDLPFLKDLQDRFSFQQVLLLLDEHLLCKTSDRLLICPFSQAYLDHFDYLDYLDQFFSYEFKDFVKIVLDRVDNSCFFAITQNQLFYLKFDGRDLKKTLIYESDDDQQTFIDFDVSFNHISILLYENSILLFDCTNLVSETCPQPQTIHFDSSVNCSDYLNIYCDDLNFYLYDKSSQIAYMYSFSDTHFSKIINNVTAIYSSDFVVLKIDDSAISISGVTYVDEDQRFDSADFIYVKLGQIYTMRIQNDQIQNSEISSLFPMTCYSNESQVLLIDHVEKDVLSLTNDNEELLPINNFESISLINNSVIFSNDDKLYAQNESHPIYNPKKSLASKIYQIRPDQINPLRFYATTKNKFHIFKLDSKGKAKREASYDFRPIKNYSVSARYIAVYDSTGIHISPNYDQLTFERFPYDMCANSCIYVDNTFLYIYNLMTLDVTKIDIKEKRNTQVYHGVSQVITGDEIGLQLSNLSIIFDQFEPVVFQDGLPEATCICNGKLYRAFAIPDTNSKTYIDDPYELTYSKQKLELTYDEETIYCKPTCQFYFKTIGENNYYRINGNQPIECNDDYSRILINDDYQIISSKDGSLRLESIFNQKIKSEPYQPQFPIISMTTHPHQQHANQFFGLADNGNLYLFTVDFERLASNPFSYQLIAVQVICFSVSQNYLITLLSDNQIFIRIYHDSTFESNKYFSTLDEQIQPNFIRFYNDDTYLYILHRVNDDIQCIKMKLIFGNTDPTETISNLQRVWETSNTNLLVFQFKSNHLQLGDDEIDIQSEFDLVGAYGRSLYAWQDYSSDLQLFKIEESILNTFYNGSCCFYFLKYERQFTLTFNNLDPDDTDDKKLTKTIEYSIPNNIFSATVIAINTVVLSTYDGLTLFFPPSSSIHLPSPVPNLTNLQPHPNHMECFFGISMSMPNLYLLRFDGFDITAQKIAENVNNYSVSSKYLLLELDEQVLICDINNVNSVKHTINKDQNKTFEYRYYIDADYFYIHTIPTNESQLGEVRIFDLIKTEQIGYYSNVVRVFPSFSVVLVLKDNKFVFKNTLFEEAITDDSLFAACKNDVCFWKDRKSSPTIFQQHCTQEAVINCSYDDANKIALLFKRGQPKFTLKCQKDFYTYPTRNSKYIFQLSSPELLRISNGAFIATFINSTQEDTAPLYHQMARADYYRSDPSDFHRLFAYFERSKEVYLVEIQFLENSRSFQVRCKGYCHDVLFFDVSKTHFVYVDSNHKLNILKRSREIPITITCPDIILKDEIIPFVDDDHIYLFNLLNKIVEIMSIHKRGITKVEEIPNVVSIWNSTGVVFQTYSEGKYYLHISRKKVPLKQKLFAVAVNHDTYCYWTSISSNPKIKTIGPDDNNTTNFEDQITEFKHQLTKIFNTHISELNKSYAQLCQKFTKTKDAMAQLNNAVQTEDITSMSHEQFGPKLLTLPVTCHPVQCLLYLKKAIEILKNIKLEPNNYQLYVSHVTRLMTHLSLDDLTLISAQNILHEYREFLPVLQKRALMFGQTEFKRTVILLGTVIDSLLI